MSLDFYYEKVKNSDEVIFETNNDGEKVYASYMWPICSTLMAIGISSIKEDNIDQIMRRYAFLTGLFYPQGGSIMIERDTFIKLIGLTTNVFKETDNQFTKKMWTNFTDRIAKSHELISDKQRKEE